MHLEYFVYVENISRRKIEKYNVLNDIVINEIRNRTKGINDKESFAEAVKTVLMYRYWAKSEYEVVITDWPPRVDTDEISRLVLEVDRFKKEIGREPYSLHINPLIAKKIDVFEQIQLNWDIFIDYLWNNLRR